MIQILGTDQFYWDADNIYIYDTTEPLNQIRIGRYDGTNYGIGFTEDGGATWETAIGFHGVQIGSLTILDVENQLSETRVEVHSSEGTVYNTDASPTLSTTLTARVYVGTILLADLTGYSFQWQESSNNGVSWVDISGATSSTLSYSAVTTKLVRVQVIK